MNTGTGTNQAYDLRILLALRRITRAVALHSRQLSVLSHITAPQLICLRTVVDKGPLTATAISREMHVSASTVVGVLDRLEDKQLVVRERSKTDRRVVYISATSSGQQLAASTPSPLQQKLQSSLQALPEDEQAAMTLSLERVVALIEADTAGRVPVTVPPPLEIAGHSVDPEADLVG